MLTASLSTERGDDDVRFALLVENEGDEPATLSFRSGKRADFAVRDGNEEMWRWSAGRMFTQALGSVTVDPGETLPFEGTWEEPEPGEYTAVGELAADDREVTAETGLSV